MNSKPSSKKTTEIYHCENCEHEGPADDFVPAKNLTLRVAPGERYTDKECSKCGALAHLLPPLQDWTVMSATDGNDTFTVEARTTEDAALQALSELQWSLCEPHEEDDDA